MKYNILQEKSFKFALSIVRFSKVLNNKKEYVLSKQLLRSGTSIGANIEESLGAQSTKDFLSKLSIAYKEARETNYWLRIIQAQDINSDVKKLIEDCEELLKIIGTIQKNTKRNL